jgi:N-hydroxyarylamine O-acetyltransferase
MDTGMDADAYLARIGVARGASLATLHEAHVRSVPSEDYDIHRGVPLSLDVEDLYDKIVRRHRGGYCYELNGLFAALLRELGFAVTLVSAFTLDDDGARGPEFDHLRLLVDGEWIADVGNGSRWLRPVPLRPGLHGDVDVRRKGELWWDIERHPKGGWERGWAWTPQPRELSDFLPRCRYHEHDPDSHFVATRFAVLATDLGRVSLVNGVFAETGRPDRRVDADEERALLAERFGIVLDGAPA